MMLFSEFQRGAAQHVFAGLGEQWLTILRQAGSYEDLRSTVVRVNDKDIGRFVAAVRRYAGKCSTGEFRLLLAICSLCDFGHIADEFASGHAWQNIARSCDREFRAAIAACVEASPG